MTLDSFLAQNLNLIIAFAALGALVAAGCAIAMLVRQSAVTALGERLAALGEGARQQREDFERQARDLRGELREQIAGVGAGLQGGMELTRTGVETRIDTFGRAQAVAAESLRSEVGRNVAAFGEGLKAEIKTVMDALSQGQVAFQGRTQDSLEAMNRGVAALAETVERRLVEMRAGNDAKLEQMRQTVDEKLQGTLERRLGESFALVSERLENVQRGLGEMQTLALGVGDLKKVLANVKDRGGWAEVQLGMMLEDMLHRDQYEMNVVVDRTTSERVEYIVRFPGQDAESEVWLPIDAKFPKEDYERLIDAMQAGDAGAIKLAQADLARTLETEAKKISGKYIRPPRTTDFAVMYLPTEGLFAEAMRQPGLAARFQVQHRVTIAGPTTLAALLSSFQMGFRTLAIQKRSGEVWRVLGEAKAEFEKYGAVLEKLKKQLETAQKTVDEAGTRTRAVTRKLRSVELVDGTPVAPPQFELTLIEDEAE